MRYLDTIEFLDTCVYKQTTLTKLWNSNLFVQIYYIVISDTLVGFFLEVLFCSLL